MKLIVEMEMPKYCADCPMIALSDRGMICLCTEALLEIDYDKKRPSWCPIKGELVRCKECSEYRDSVGACHYFNYEPTDEMDFCSHGIRADGERKDGERRTDGK